MVLYWLIFSATVIFVACSLLLIFLKFWLLFRKSRQKIVGDRDEKVIITTVAFFHPYCNAGGGGERVLWLAIRALQKKYGGRIKCYVYTGDVEATPDEILTKAEGRFGLARISGVDFFYLKRRSLVEARLYPYFTLLGQSLGGLLLGLEAIFSFVPDVFIDSMGYSFVTPLFYYLAGCRTASYVHYPTISIDMLSLVEKRRENFNNRRFISDNAVLSYCKLIYYRIFARMYGLSGKSSMVVMVNSTWTYNHVIDLWSMPNFTKIVYPPCDVRNFLNLESEAEKLLMENSEIRLISVGQFRPEKNHLDQLKSLHLLINNPEFKAMMKKSMKLIFVGGCRNDDDARRVDWLKKEAENLGLADFVVFKLNASFDVLKEEFSRALIGLHSMKNEHFGIGVVECLAAGLITIAHKSGGPLTDIIEDGRDGFLAENPPEYARKMLEILKMDKIERDSIRKLAKKSCQRFSDENFQEKFCLATEKIFEQ